MRRLRGRAPSPAQPPFQEDSTAESLLDGRLTIVTGKGGTGKTTVAAALALAAAERGLRVCVVETGRDEVVPRLLGWTGPPAGYAGVEPCPGLRTLRMAPYEALAEYLALQLPLGNLAGPMLRNPAFRQLMDAAPGWRELITLGKVWHLEQARAEDADDPEAPPAWDLLIVDAPATGHGLTFLDVPRVVVSAVRAGPLRRHARWVESLVRDPERTRILPVALAEELPARETVELVERVRDDMGVAVDRVVVNAVEPEPFPEAVPDLDARLAALPALPRPAPDVAALRHAAVHLRARRDLHTHHRVAIGRATGLPLVTLPRLPGGATGTDALRQLGAALLTKPEAV